MMRRLTAMVLLILAGPATAVAPEDGTIWFSLEAANGARLGHASHRVVETADGREIRDDSEILVQELADPPTRITGRTIIRQDRAGRTLSVSIVSQVGRGTSRTEARIGADAAEITRETPVGRRTVRVPLGPRVRFDDGAGLLAGWDIAATPRLEYDNLDVSAMVVEHVVLEAAPAADGRLLVLRRRYDGGALRAVARLVLDRDRRLVSTTQPMFGTAITARTTDRATALRAHPPYTVLANSLVRAPFRMPPSALQGHVRYRAAFVDSIAFALPQTGEQAATSEGAGVTLDICAGCGPGLPHDPATLADALRPTAWLQSDDRRLRRIAAPVARLAVSDARKMELLLARARPYLARVDFTGHYSAVETIRRRAGDCTEAAVLLAALGRAAGIPTRVANGLVYSRERYHGVSNVFMPHSWVLAFVDGRWRSFDLALDAFDASHIAITVGDGDARSVQAASQLASLLHWENMAEIRIRPAR